MKVKEFIKGHLFGFAIVILFIVLIYQTVMFVLKSNNLI